MTRIATGHSPDSTVSVARASISTAGPEGGSEAEATSSATISVEMGDYFFRPRDVAISAGDTVSWVNEGTVPEGHTATGDGFDSGVLEEGETYTHAFETAGTFDYVCTLHPAMRGTVTVTGSASGGGGGGDESGEASGGGGSTTPTGGNSGGVPSGSSGGGPLASTGLNLILIAEIGMCLLAGGLLARRLIRA
jgi:plastocyanin